MLCGLCALGGKRLVGSRASRIEPFIFFTVTNKTASFWTFWIFMWRDFSGQDIDSLGPLRINKMQICQGNYMCLITNVHDYVLIMNGSLRETSGSDFSFWYSVCHHGISLWVSMAMTWRNCKNEPEWQHSYGSYGNSQSKARPPLTPPVCYSPLERDAHSSGTLGRINKTKTKWCNFTKRKNKTCTYKTGQKRFFIEKING